jgi:hypothetical protein
LAVKVADGFFLIGLSAAQAERDHNLRLLKEQPWLETLVVYNTGRRPVIALEKGTTGETAFAEAFAAWHE